MTEPVSTVSRRYANSAWGYEILEINGPPMVVRSDDGRIRTLEVETAARIWGELEATAKQGGGGRKRGSVRARAASRPAPAE